MMYYIKDDLALRNYNFQNDLKLCIDKCYTNLCTYNNYLQWGNLTPISKFILVDRITRSDIVRVERTFQHTDRLKNYK